MARYSIWANHYIVGSGWGTAQLIETDDRGDAFEPQVAVDSAGNAIVTWMQYDGSHYNAMASRFAVGAGWGAARSLGDGVAGDAEEPQVAVDPAGDAIAVWRQHDGSHYNAMANRFTVGTGWGAARTLGIGVAGVACNPQVAVDPTGNAIAVWNQWNDTRGDIMSSRYTAGAGWDAAQLIETDDRGNAQVPRVAMDPSGNAIAVWQQNDGTRESVGANRYTTGSGWGAAQLIETDNAGDASSPNIVMSSAGSAIAVWAREGSDGGGIWTNSYATSSGWGSGRLAWSISEFDLGGFWTEGIPVAMDPAGNALVVLTLPHDTGGGFVVGQVWANYYTAGVGWDTLQLIEIDNSKNGDLPQVAMDASGNAIAVWEQSDGTRMNIWANSFR